MKKIVALVLIGIMVLSGLGAAAVSKTSETSLKKTETITFSNPEITNKEDYTYVTLKNANAWLNTPGAPMLPASITTYIFPFGTKIKTIDVTFSEPEEYILEKEIAPTPKPVTFVAGTKVTYNQETQAIGSTYPEKL
jgi:hypothetical protein